MAKALKNPHEPIPTTEQHERDFSTRHTTLDKEGREILSPLPLEPPLGYKKSESMAEMVRRMIQSEHLRIAAEQAGAETFEESEDFDIGDDFEPHSPWENDFDPPISELTQAGIEIQREKAAKAAAASAAQNSDTPPPVSAKAPGGAEGV
ncbi:hypothetical protein [robinz microvirus RP_145]|nr:hypothetical protein [robinz microvirus RP_145]